MYSMISYSILTIASAAGASPNISPSDIYTHIAVLILLIIVIVLYTSTNPLYLSSVPNSDSFHAFTIRGLMSRNKILKPGSLQVPAIST